MSIEESLFLELLSRESQLMLLLATASDLLIEFTRPFVFVRFVVAISGSANFFMLVAGFLLKTGLDPPPMFLMRFLSVLGFSSNGDSLLFKHQ